MKNKAILFLFTFIFCASVRAQTSAFTYQGRLVDNGSPANGTYQLRMILQNNAGTQVGSAFAYPVVSVTNGLFTVTLDFGPNVFDGSVRFLEIGVRTNGSVAPYTLLSPRQEITSAPYALQAQTANTVLGNISDIQLSANIPRLTDGVIADSQLSSNIARLNVTQAFTGSNTFRGGVNIVDGTSQNGNLHIGGYGAGGDAKVIKFGDGDFVSIGENLADDLLQFNATTFAFTSGGDGFVGIGVTNPASKLHVSGTVTGTSFVGSGTGLTGIPQLGANQSFTGTVNFSPASGAPFTVNNSNKVTGLNADLLDGLDSGSFWQLGGNSGTTAGTHFLGTTDNQALEIKVNGTRALRLEPNSSGAPNVIGGSPRNFAGAGAVGVTIAGGGATNYAASSYTNSVFAPFGTIGGGAANRIGPSAFSTIAGGQFNDIGTNSGYGTVVGGFDNNVGGSSLFATIVGGGLNDIGTNSGYSVIGGGNNNNISTNSGSSTIAGGEINDIGFGTLAGTIGGGYDNNLAADTASSTIAGGELNDIGVTARSSTIGGGHDNNIGMYSLYSTIAGGYWNDIGINAISSVIGGGFNNNVADDSMSSTIAGGEANDLGGNNNSSVIGGGYDNNTAANSDFITIAGGKFNNIGTNADLSVISGGTNNYIGSESYGAAIGGGGLNDVGTNSSWGTIGGGYDNNIAGYTYGVWIGGGYNNTVGFASTSCSIGGGELNNIAFYGSGSTIAGGKQNTIGQGLFAATIAGGDRNTISSSSYGAIGGGQSNNITVNATCGAIPGGFDNAVIGSYGFAAGRHAKANHAGAFVWGDSTDADIASTNNNSMTIRAAGGTRIFSSAAATVGVFVAPGSGTWASMSDRNMKENFSEVDAREVLDKVAALPITTWNYKTQDAEKRHIGPMAQDFSAAFGVGENNTSITSVDEGGVALAAIQGLNEVVKQKDAKIANLEKRLSDLEQLVQSLAKGNNKE